MRESYKNFSHEPQPLTGIGIIGHGAPGADPRIPTALHRLEGQAEYLHQAINTLADRLHVVCRASTPNEQVAQSRMDLACDMEAFIERQTEGIALAHERLTDLIRRLEL